MQSSEVQRFVQTLPEPLFQYMSFVYLAEEQTARNFIKNSAVPRAALSLSSHFTRLIYCCNKKTSTIKGKSGKARL
jgi:hypothetical protein